jgi:D-amino peptidase
MKTWISFDMEGVAGIVDWDQCRPSGGARYEVGCQLMLAEVNAAIEGAIAGGATEVVLNDSHGTMANLDPRAVAGGAGYVSGRHKPMYMMQGLDDSFDAVFLVGYHGSISGEPSTLSHTYNPEVFAAARVNGTEVGESGINLHPTESCRLIREGAERAMRAVAAGSVGTPGISRPATLELDVQTGDMAEVASWARGVERTGERTVAITGDDLLAVFRSFVAVTYITRQAGGR